MEPFIGMIIVFAGNFAPRGWALCNGQLLPIAQNTALFSILGTTYGGDGRTTFALPDLRGRVPVHPGQGPGLSNYSLGQVSGTETVTLTTQNLPAHTHTFAPSCATTIPNAESPANNVPANLESDADLLHRAERQHAPSELELHRRLAARRQLAAALGRQLHHRARRHLPEPQLKRSAARTRRRRDASAALGTRLGCAGRRGDGV
ncbi:MAG: tail fiber protein [Polyangiaceae bacterium]